MTKTKQVSNIDVQADKINPADYVPALLIEKKAELERIGWTFEINEKLQWAAAGGTSRWEWYNDLDKLFRLIEKDKREPPTDKVTGFPAFLEPQTRIVEWSFLQEIAETNSCGSTFIDKGTIKEPFEFEGGLYIATSSTSSGRTEYTEAEAYRVLTEDEFKEILVEVEKKAGQFYHGEKVKYKKEEFILALPKIKFVLSFDFDVLTDSGWNYKREDSYWFAEKTFDGDDTATTIYSVETPEKLFDLCREKDRRRAAQTEETGAPDPTVESDSGENEIQDSVESKTPLPMFSVESCRFDLSDDEILQRTYSMRHAQAELLAEESRFAGQKDVHKSNMKMIGARVEKFGHAIDTKSEYRELECSLEYDLQKEAVITRRPDTDEVISRRGMTKEERQKRLF